MSSNYYKKFYLERYTPEENLATQWKKSYDSLMNMLDYKRNTDEIDGVKFVARLAIRKIQELKSAHMDLVESHYYRMKIQKLALELANDPELISHALQAKIDLEYKEYMQACENIISCGLANAGYPIDDAVVGLWGWYPGKYKLSENADKEYKKIDFWHPIGANGIKNRDHEFDNTPVEIKKTKNPFKTLSKLPRTLKSCTFPVLHCILVDVKPNSSLVKCSKAVWNDKDDCFKWVTVDVVTDFKVGECHICVPHKTFVDTMKVIGDEPFTITENKDEQIMIITGDNFRTEIKGIDAQEFPANGGSFEN